MNNFLDTDIQCKNVENLHRQFIILGRERNKITYKLLALLPQIYKQKIYSAHGYATIFEYAGKLAGLSHSVVEKALKLEEKLKDKPFLQKAIETQGVHKIAIVASLATPENEKMFADKVENMSKPALQQFSKEIRGKIQTNWQIEMDEEMMITFLKLKEKVGRNLSNKEALRRMFVMMAKNEKSQVEAKNQAKIPGEQTRSERSERSVNPKISAESPIEASTQIHNEHCKQSVDPKSLPETPPKTTRYIPAAQKRKVLASTNGQCSYKNCCNPAQIFHHQIRFSQTPNHSSIIPLCKIHHEFAHNGITETLVPADTLYRKYRQKAIF